MINEFRLGYVRTRFFNEPQGLGTNHTVLSGIGGFVEQSSDFPGFPGLGITGYLGFNPNAFSPIKFRDNKYEILDNLTWIRGAHALKFGAHFRRYDTATTNAARSRGDFTFSGTYTGNSWSDFLLGLPFQGRRTFPRELRIGPATVERPAEHDAIVRRVVECEAHVGVSHRLETPQAFPPRYIGFDQRQPQHPEPFARNGGEERCLVGEVAVECGP